MPPLVIDIRGAEDRRDVVHRGVQAIVEGKLVAFPTETVYGLAANALDEDAIERLLRAKQRRTGHPLTLAIKSADEALDYVPSMSALAQRLARRCWPGPVTLVMEDSHPDSLLQQLPASVRQAIAPSGSIGLRAPGHQTVLDMLKMLPGPIALTSANRAGEPEALTAQEVVQKLGDDVQLVIDDGRSRFGQASSVVKVTESGFEILRAGVVSEQALRRFASFIVLFVCTGNTCRSPMAEAICKQILAQRVGCSIDKLEDHGVLVRSAGIAAMMGSRPSPEAVDVVGAMGLDLTNHESQQLSERLVCHADLIWTMTRSHRQAIVSEWPAAAARTAVLCRDGVDISDPLGGPPEYYQRCAQQIRAELEARVGQWKL